MLAAGGVPFYSSLLRPDSADLSLPSSLRPYVSSSYSVSYSSVLCSSNRSFLTIPFVMSVFYSISPDIECIWRFFGIFHVHFRLCLFFGTFPYVRFLLYLLYFLVVFGIFYVLLPLFYPTVSSQSTNSSLLFILFPPY